MNKLGKTLFIMFIAAIIYALVVGWLVKLSLYDYIVPTINLSVSAFLDAFLLFALIVVMGIVVSNIMKKR